MATIAIRSKIKKKIIFGIGGAGTAILNNFDRTKMFDETVQFLVADTSKRSLSQSKITNQLQLGKNVTHGKGCGGSSALGKAAAMEASEEIEKSLEGAGLVVIVAGASGGAGSSGAQVVAGIAKDMGLRVASILIHPFDQELRERLASDAIEKMKSLSDSVTVLFNSNLNRLKDRFPEMDLRSSFGWQDMRVYEELQKIIKAL